MKKLSRFLQIAVLAWALIMTYNALPKNENKIATISYAQAAALAQGMTPDSLYSQNTKQSSSMTKTPVDYALSQDINIYNPVPYKGNQGVIEYDNLPIFQDLNGDGLADMIFSARTSQGSSNYIQYVMINNGHGFNIAYYCSAEPSNNVYRGHCAE